MFGAAEVFAPEKGVQKLGTFLKNLFFKLKIQKKLLKFFFWI